MTAVDQLASTLDALRRVRLRRQGPKRWWQRGPGLPRVMALLGSTVTANPFEFYVLLSLVIAGLTFFFTPLMPRAIIDAGGGGIGMQLWAGTLAFGSLCALVGGAHRTKLERGMAVYQFGYGLCGTACLVYGVSVLVFRFETGLMSGVMNLGFAIACWVRVWQIKRFFDLAEQHLHDVTAEQARWRAGEQP